VLTGQVYPVAGPSASLSWVLAGCVCGLSALSYMELSARIPTKGSCYAFSFHALGEAPAVVGAVCLTLEYGLSGAGVARNWSAKVAALFTQADLAKYMFVPYTGTLKDDGDDDFYVDVPAGVLQVGCVLICVVGLKLGKVVINGFTVAKVLLVFFMIVVGFAAWRVNIFESNTEFFPQGAAGTLSGTSLLFFGYIGFDEVCCLAGKSENPAQVMTPTATTAHHPISCGC
jgi:basic amino acid/polyamine antiporter, APA family